MLARQGLFNKPVNKAEDTDLLIRLHVMRTILLSVAGDIGQGSSACWAGFKRYDAVMAQAYEHIIQKNLAALTENPDLWAELHYKTGWLYYHGGNKPPAPPASLAGYSKESLPCQELAGIRSI